MRFIQQSLRQLLCVGLLGAGAGAWADCVDTVGLTPPERDFYLRANAALKALLPPQPVADGIWHADTLNESGQMEVCKGDKKPGNFSPVVSRKYVWPDPKKNMADAVVTLSLTINAPTFESKDGRYSGIFGAPSAARSAGLKVQNVTWALSGSSYGIASQIETLRASLAARLERERLESLVGRPLPTVAESDSAAKKAAPTVLLASAPAEPVAAPAAAQGPGNAAAQPAATAATPSTNAPAPAAAAAPAPVNTVNDVAGTVQKLRGLFGK